MKITMTLTRIGFGGLMGESVNKRVQDRGGGRNSFAVMETEATVEGRCKVKEDF